MRVFKNMDTDKSGFVSAQELRDILSQHNQHVKSDVIEGIIKSCDKNGDSLIDFKEFLAGVSQV